MATTRHPTSPDRGGDQRGVDDFAAWKKAGHTQNLLDSRVTASA